MSVVKEDLESNWLRYSLRGGRRERFISCKCNNIIIVLPRYNLGQILNAGGLTFQTTPLVSTGVSSRYYW